MYLHLLYHLITILHQKNTIWWWFYRVKMEISDWHFNNCFLNNFICCIIFDINMVLCQRWFNNLNIVTDTAVQLFNFLSCNSPPVCSVICFYLWHFIQFSFYHISFVFLFSNFPSYIFLCYYKQPWGLFHSTAFNQN